MRGSRGVRQLLGATETWILGSSDCHEQESVVDSISVFPPCSLPWPEEDDVMVLVVLPRGNLWPGTREGGTFSLTQCHVLAMRVSRDDHCGLVQIT